MSTIALYARKTLFTLPGSLEANTIYAVRRDTGFDLFITDSSGLIAHKLNNTDDPLKSPVFTYTGGKLTGVTYSDGSTKILNYTNNELTSVDLIRNGVTTRKTLNYTGSVLTSILETVL